MAVSGNGAWIPDPAPTEAQLAEAQRRALALPWARGLNPALVGKGARVGLTDAQLAVKVARGQGGDTAARALSLKAGVSKDEFFTKRRSWLSKFETNVFQPVVQGVVIGGIAVGAAGAAGFGPAAGTPTTVAAGTPAAPGASYSGMALAGGSGPVGTTAAASGTGLAGATAAQAGAGGLTVAKAAATIKGGLELTSAAVGVAGGVKAVKSMGMSAAAGMPAYAAQLTPTTAAGIRTPDEGGKGALAILAILAALVVFKGA